MWRCHHNFTRHNISATFWLYNYHFQGLNTTMCNGELTNTVRIVKKLYEQKKSNAWFIFHHRQRWVESDRSIYITLKVNRSTSFHLWLARFFKLKTITSIRTINTLRSTFFIFRNVVFMLIKSGLQLLQPDPEFFQGGRGSLSRLKNLAIRKVQENK